MPKGDRTRYVKYFTREALLAANEEAIRAGVKQAITPERILELPETMCFPVFMFHPLSLDRYRVTVVMNVEGDVALLDCLRSTVLRLPTRAVRVRYAA